MNSRLRFGARFIIAAAVIFCAAFPAAAEAQQAAQRPQSENLLSWEELAAHAGLTGLKVKTLKEYQVDGAYDGFRGYFDLIQASIQLTPEEWTRLESGGHPMLNPWTTGKIDYKTWKSTVDLILDAEEETDAAPKAKTGATSDLKEGWHSPPPRGRKVDTNRLEMNDKAVLLHRPFFNPDAKNIEQLYDSMRKALDGDKALILHVNSNGEHSGMIVIHLDDKGNLVNTLYDPAGSYTGKNHEKGSGDVLTNELPTNGPQHVGWSLADYIEHHVADGAMSFVPIWTDGDTARKLEFPANTMGGFCADSSCQVIQQIPGFTKSGIFGPYWPDSLSDQLHRSMGRRVTIQHQP